MRIRWHGQSAYTLTGADRTVAIGPFGDLGALLGGRRRPEQREAIGPADASLTLHDGVAEAGHMAPPDARG